MRRFLTKARIQLVALVFIVIGMIAIAGNVSLAVKKQAIERSVDAQFTHQISIGSLYYLFPNKILFKNVSVASRDFSLKNPSFTVKRMTVRFAFWELLLNGTLNVSRVTLYPSKVSYYALSRFLEKNFQAILRIIESSPGNNIDIRVKETLLDFDREGQPDYIAVQALVSVKDDVMGGVGFFRADQYQFFDSASEEGARRTVEGWPLWYKFTSRLMPDGLEVDELVFRSGVLHSKLWGGIRSGTVKVNGFAFLNTAKKEFERQEYASDRYFKEFPYSARLMNIDTHILDIDGRMRLDLPGATVEKLTFTLNNIPVTVQGSFLLQDALSMQAQASFLGGKVPGKKNLPFKEIDMTFSGQWKGGILTTDVDAEIDFMDRGDFSLVPDSAKMYFRGLSFYFDRDKRSNIDLSRGDVVYWTKKKEHKLSVEDLKIKADTKMEGFKVIEMDAPFYGGSLNGRIWVDSSKTPSKVTSDINLTDIDTGALEELVAHFAKFNGKMSSKMRFTNIPQLDLSGDITLYDGILTDLAFFSWLSDAFRLPELKSINFERASAHFSINENRAQMRDIYFQTDGVNISGYYGVDGRNLVSSKLSLALSKALLSKSPKFKPVLKIFPDHPPYLDFDFQLSGNMDSMNFQWLSSETKQKIQARIPDFIERMIEKDIDAFMEKD